MTKINTIREEEAGSFHCPIARTQGANPINSQCVGAKCILWRWQEISISHPNWKPAIQKLGKELEEKPPYPKAARIIADSPEKFDMKLEFGWCGLGGKP